VLLDSHLQDVRAHMQRTALKISCFFIITLLVLQPIVILKTKAKEHQQNDEKNNEVLNTDEKIQEIIQKINETLVRNFMEYLLFEIGSRYTGTPGCQQAAQYIYEQFEDMGLQVRYQNWSAKINKSDPNPVVSQNVEATQQGMDYNNDDIIIFNAHYDTVKDTVGANDDGSGTVGVLAAAYVLSQYRFNRTMKFVTFSGEEQGLFGSDAYVRELYDSRTPVLVEFNADGIGRATTTEYGRKIRLSVTEDTGWITEIMQNMTKEYGLNFTITTLWKVNRGLPFGFSDYFHFVRHGYESISVWQADGDPNYHSPRDNISNINVSYLVNVTRHIAATMAILADIEVEVPQISLANPRYGKLVYQDNIIKNMTYDTPIVIGETNISAEVQQGVYPIDRVEFYYGNTLLFTDKEKPYEYLLNKRSVGLHMIKVVVYDTKEHSATDKMKIWFVNLKCIQDDKIIVSQSQNNHF
jgi:hypothetical protein